MSDVDNKPSRAEQLAATLSERFGEDLTSCAQSAGGVVIEVPGARLSEVCLALRDEKEFAFEVLIDLCGMDYAAYGKAEWTTSSSSGSGFSRGVEEWHGTLVDWAKQRFAVVYQLLSIRNNQRLTVRCFAEGEVPMVDSVIAIWSSANWFEREAFDMFGIVFEGHPDLRRILTDYGFIGHPFRKDFPLTGHVEMRYDPEKKRVVYEPVSIEPRTLVPRILRDERAAPVVEPAPLETVKSAEGDK